MAEPATSATTNPLYGPNQLKFGAFGSDLGGGCSATLAEGTPIFRIERGFREPKPIPKPHFSITNAGRSGTGNRFALKHAEPNGPPEIQLRLGG